MTGADDHNGRTPFGITRRNGLDGSAWSRQKLQKVGRQFAHQADRTLPGSMRHTETPAAASAFCFSVSRADSSMAIARAPSQNTISAGSSASPTGTQPRGNGRGADHRKSSGAYSPSYGFTRSASSVPMRLDLRRDTAKIRGDELSPQRRIVAAQPLQPLLRRRHARGVIADCQRHRIRRHRLAVQSQRFAAHLHTAQPRIVQRDRARQTIEAIRNPQAAQPLTCRISFAQPSITGRMVSAFSDSRLNTTRETPRSS